MPVSHFSPSDWAETLTGREREILALLAEDQSNQAIASRLHLSLSTVKWYLRQIYGKLDVDDRAAGRLTPGAVEAARARGERLGYAQVLAHFNCEEPHGA